MLVTSFTATAAERRSVTVAPRQCGADSTPTEATCIECEQSKVQISALNRTVDILTDETDGTRMALRNLEAEMASLRESVNLERSTAAHAADQLRIERDTFRGRLEEVSILIARTNASA